MRRTLKLILVLLACTVGFSSAYAASNSISALWAKARADIGSNSPVPVYLPSHLPSMVTKYGVKLVFAQRTKHGYEVSFYYVAPPSDATFAGFVSGSDTTLDVQAISNIHAVHLRNGTKAWFRPINCGGSCAPANLWWQVSGHEYQLQLKLSSSMSSNAQLSAMLLTANSMVHYP